MSQNVPSAHEINFPCFVVVECLENILFQFNIFYLKIAAADNTKEIEKLLGLFDFS